MKIPKSLLVLPALLYTFTLHAQSLSLTGKLTDETDNSTLIGATVVVVSIADTSMQYGNVTDENGKFIVENLPSGQYRLKAVYVGFDNYSRVLSLFQNTDLGTISMKPSSTQLKSVTLKSEAVRATQSGDTTNFNANAFKTNPDANAEDLINKMPGISTQDGTLKAGGEEVKQILVDGKPFFGDDPNAAIKNLPAEVIDKIQVFDRLSDQAQLTGFDDGNAQKTINIITKPGKNTGQFGKIFGGIGSRDETLNNPLYIAGGNLNYFKGSTRLSLIALSNNINQQNFSADDLTGVMSSTSGSNRGGGGGSGGRGGGRDAGPGGRGDNSAGNFLVGQQGGITKTNSIGLNYSDEWGKKVKVSGSYFFNNTDNNNTTTLTRNYLTTSDSGLVYKEHSAARSKNTNHRANLRLEYEIDSNNTLILTPRISLQQNDYSKTLTGTSRLWDSSLVSATNNRTASNNFAYNLSNNLVYRHKFAKQGRTISLNLNTQLNDRKGDGKLYSLNEYTGSDTSLLDQQYDLQSNGYTLSGSINYTEPLSKNAQLMVNYAPSYAKNKSDKETKNNNGSGDYADFDTLLSNKYENTYLTQRGGVNYRFNNQKIRFAIGADYQYATLDGIQVFPYAFSLQKNFSNVLPNAWFNYTFTKNKNMRIMYRTNTNVPTIQQLQNVIDNSNPLLLKTGNPNLSQSYQHTLMMRYGATNTTKATSFNAMVFGNYTNDYIANQTIIPTTDSSIAEGILLNSGSQLTRPVNLDGYYSVRSFMSYGMPLKVLKTNLNLNAGVNYNHLPGLINNRMNYANNYTLSGGVVLSSNISENLDFTLAYTGNYNVVRNTIQTQSNANYYTQTTSARINYIFLNGFVFNTTLNHQLYSGLSEGYNQNFLLWNAGLGYKFLKDRSLDIRLNVYDLLNQNRAIARTVTETYIEDSYTNVLQRYFMLNATYTLRRFGGKKVSEQELERQIDSDGEGRERQKRMRERENGGMMQGHPPTPGGGTGF
ncbi:MAG TPA: outer membrane beta-barrel protein [Flavipsychrobacter sp.]|nr:outer membrane beta-barrel protein [Flavipsychrobacter sp.]